MGDRFFAGPISRASVAVYVEYVVLAGMHEDDGVKNGITQVCFSRREYGH